MASGSWWNLWVWLAGGGCGWNLWQCSKLRPVKGQIPVNFRACLVKVQVGQSQCPDESVRGRRSGKPRPQAIAQQRRGA